MCGRFSLKTRPDELVDHFELAEQPGWAPRYNIAPTQTTGVVRAAGGVRTWDEMRWGLVPAGAPGIPDGAPLINARAETVREKPSFRVAFEHRRCLVPFDGFYEWKGTHRGKQPIHFRRPDHRVMAFAGLWEKWVRPDGLPLESFAILTTGPNALVRGVHDRMPVILAPPAYGRWLDPVVSPEELMELLGPFPDGVLEAVEVNPVVNGTTVDGPECLEPPPPPVELDLFEDG